MDYNKKIQRIFLEMPAFDDSQLSLGNQSPKDKDINDKRLFNVARLNKLVINKQLQNNLSIEMYENSVKEYFYVYLVQTEQGKRHVAGLIDIIDNSYPFPSVQSSYVDAPFQGKGYSKLLYRTAIGYLGGLVSDAKLTGEHVHGSFNIWASLGKEFYTYVVDENNEVSEVGNFDKSMMNSENTRFMVTLDEYEVEELY